MHPAVLYTVRCGFDAPGCCVYTVHYKGFEVRMHRIRHVSWALVPHRAICLGPSALHSGFRSSGSKPLTTPAPPHALFCTGHHSISLSLQAPCTGTLYRHVHTYGSTCNLAWPTFALRRQTVASNVLVGSYCKFSNQGGVVHPKTSIEDLDELSSLLQV